MDTMQAFSFTVIRNPDFRNLILSRVFALLATQAMAVIVGWQVYAITKSAFMLGLVGLAEALPALACALFAGYIVDISHPQKIFRLCLLTLLVNMAILMVFAGGLIPLPDSVVLVAIFVGVMTAGLARSFIMPANFTMVQMILTRRDVSAAAAWQSLCAQVAFIGGPVLGGLVFGFAGALAAWGMVVALMLTGLLISSQMRVIDKRTKADKRPPAWQSIKEGWAFLLSNRALLSTMSLDMLAVLFGGAMAVLPAFAGEVLHTGPEGLGLLRAAPAVGALVTALYFALQPMRTITAFRLLFVVAGFGVCIIAFGLSTTLPAAMLFLALSGAFDSVSMVIRGTLIQLLTPEAMRGRVSSVNSMFIISSNELGAFVSGTGAALLGLIPSIIAGGAGTLAVVALVAALSPKFRTLRIEA